MLGEQISEENGQITGMRVLPGGSVEVSFQQTGTLLGSHVTDMGTYTSVTQPDGTMLGDGQGVIMTDDNEVASWHGQGAGHFTGQGTGVSFHGAIYYQTASQRLARLNGIAVVFDYESDDSGKTQAKAYEWK